MAKRSVFEAITAYDLNHQNAEEKANNGYVFIIDTETVSMGICSCRSDGEINLVAEYKPEQISSIYQSWFSRLSTDNLLSDDEIKDILDSKSVNEPMWDYYIRGKSEDKVVLNSASNASVTYKTIDEAFASSGNALEAAINYGIGIAEQKNIDEGALRILVVGRLSASAPVQMTVRGCFTLNPVLSLYSDKRFIDTSTWPFRDSIIEEGMAVLELQQTAKDDFSLQIIDIWGKHTDYSLMKKGEKVMTKEEAVFSLPIFVNDSDCLNIKSSFGSIKKPLPEGMLTEGIGLIELCCVQTENAPILLLRNTENKNRVFEIVLNS